MEAVDFIWMNGKMVPWKEANIHVLTHTLHYGSGVFEGIRCYKTSEGSAIFRLKDHVKRLMESAEILEIKPNFTEKEYFDVCKKIVAINKLEECYIRPIIYFGYGKMGLDSKECKVDSSVAAWSWGAYLGDEGIKNGIRAKISHYTRVHSTEILSKSKSCANAFFPIIALFG